MTKGNDLEARVRAATGIILERRNRLSELQTMIDNLRRDVERLLRENQRLLREAEVALEEGATLLERNQVLDVNRKARVESDNQGQGDLQGLTAEVEQLRSVNEHLLTLLQALAVQVELSPEAGNG